MAELDPSLLQDFITETSELVEQLDADLVTLETASAPTQAELLNRIFRSLHTVKGAAGFLGLNELTHFAHAAEDGLNRLRKGEVAVTTEVIDALLASVDVLRRMTEALAAGQALEPCPPELMAQLKKISEGAAASPAAGAEAPISATPAADNVRPLNLPSQKVDLLSFMTADLRDSVKDLAACIKDGQSDTGRTEAAERLGELAVALARTAEFFEVPELVTLTQQLAVAAQVLGTVARDLAPELLVRLSAIGLLIERQADALDRQQVLTWPLETLTTRIRQLCAGQPLATAVAGAHGGDAERVLALDGVLGELAQEPPAPASGRNAPMDRRMGERRQGERRQGERRQGERVAAGDQTIRVDVDRLEALLNLVGQMVLVKNRMLAMNRRLADRHLPQELMEDLLTTGNDLERLTGNLQVAVMRTRMQPLAKLFERYPRLVRDLARNMGKEIDLELVGKETEVDKSVLELLADPLVHLLRNSADHGIESPEVRRASGKASRGKIKLIAEHQGSHVRIAVQDDGKGIDRATIGRKAIAKGLTTAEQLETMSDEQVYHFIFAAGFSTAERVTDLSGRGVGLDVVRTNVAKMNGTVRVISTAGRGATFEILIPLTVAIMPAMVVVLGQARYCIPLQNIVEIVRPQMVGVKSVRGQAVMKLRENVLPLVDLGQRLGMAKGSGKFAVVVAVSGQQVGILVDELIGQQDIVIKPLDDVYARGGPFSGATIQENGQVSLILDVVRLVREATDLQVRQAA